MKFQVNMTWDKLDGGEVEIGESKKLRLGTPVKFGGRGKYACPDELFLSAIGGCLLTTFLFFKRKLNLRLNELHIRVDGEVKNVGLEGYRVTSLEVNLQIETAEGERSNAEKCFELAKTYCHLTRTIEKAVPTKVSARIKTSNPKR